MLISDAGQKKKIPSKSIHAFTVFCLFPDPGGFRFEQESERATDIHTKDRPTDRSMTYDQFRLRFMHSDDYLAFVVVVGDI
jgi:hypothetical protein